MHTQQALSAFDAAVSEVGVRNAGLADLLRGAFVRRLDALGSAPEGWRLVPVEPTVAMCIAGDEARHNVDDLTRTPAVYRSMLAAAPQPPAAQQGEAVAPAGRLHADGYFTWHRRDGYVLDQRLPCDFYLSPPARQAVALTEAQIAELWRASEFRGNGGQFDWFVEGMRAAERFHGITPAGGEG